jgi:hypothetical protein
MQKIYPLTITPELRAMTPESLFKKSANQNCKRGLKNAAKHQQAPFTRQSRLFPKRQK